MSEFLQKLIVTLSAGILFSSFTQESTLPSPPVPGLTLDAKCVRVIDGDTIEVESLVKYRVRLLECWAPESRTSDIAEKQRGVKSKNRMIQLADGKSVRVSIPLTEDLTEATTLGRILGRVWLEDGRELSKVMVSEGLATEDKP